MLILKQIAASFPHRLQNKLKSIHFARQIKKGTFISNEPEYKLLDKLMCPGDWVVDIGANVGHYTKRFSELVGAHGRVIAFEPVPTTFFLLSANTQLFPFQNVTLINSAVSDKLDIVRMSIPIFTSGLSNYYQAHISSDKNSAVAVLTMSLDSMEITRKISLIKIDAEGHEAFVLAGMRKLIEKWHPILIVETNSKEVIAGLESSGYEPDKIHNSPNVLFKPKK